MGENPNLLKNTWSWQVKDALIDGRSKPDQEVVKLPRWIQMEIQFGFLFW